MTYIQTTEKYQSNHNRIIKNNQGFFAFGKEQLLEEMEKGNFKKEELTSFGCGLILPKVNVKNYIKGCKEISDQYDKDIKKINPIKIIKYELNNHECYYTGDITDVVELLQCYNITKEQIEKVYQDNKVYGL